MKNENIITNRRYAESNQMFRNAAGELADKQLKPERDMYITGRQASKFRRGFGAVYQSMGR